MRGMGGGICPALGQKWLRIKINNKNNIYGKIF